MIYKTNERISKIDFLRGLAIFLVFAFHSQSCLFPNYEYGIFYSKYNFFCVSDHKKFLLNFFPTAYGWSGVELFFIISGYLIHSKYLSLQNKFNLKIYFSKRFWRIYPPYLLILLFLCFSRNGALYYVSTDDGLTSLFSHIFLIHNLFDNTFYSINPSFWSLAVEAQIYLIYPVFLILRQKFGIKRAFHITIILSLIIHTARNVINNPGVFTINYFSAFNYWFVWCVGAYMAEKHFEHHVIFPKYKGPVSFILIFIFFASKLHLYTHQFEIYFATLAWIAFFEWFITLKNSNKDNFISKAISSIGLCSYSLYLIHQPFLGNVLSFFILIPTRNFDITLVKAIPTFSVLFLISYSLYKLIELPSIEMGNNIRNKWKR